MVTAARLLAKAVSEVANQLPLVIFFQSTLLNLMFFYIKVLLDICLTFMKNYEQITTMFILNRAVN